MINKQLVNQVATAYKKLMVVAEQAPHPGVVMYAIDELRDSLSALAMETDPDVRAQIARAGGYDQWLAKEQR
jgi:hypothetical protein